MGKPDELIANSKSTAAVVIKTMIALEELMIRSTIAVTAAEQYENEWRLKSSDPAATVKELLRLIESHNNQLLDLQVRRPSLEDVFLELTQS